METNTRVNLQLLPLSTLFESKGLRGESTSVVGDRIYCLGGRDSPHFGAFVSVKSGVWRVLQVPSNVQTRFYHAAALVEDKIYFHGGELGRIYYDEMWEFDTVLATFRKIPPPIGGHIKRTGASAVFAEWKREIYFFGGMEYGTENPRKNDVFTFQVDTMRWGDTIAKGRLPVPRSTHDAVLDLYNMYIFGGFGGGNLYLNDLWIADLRVGSVVTWSMVKVTGYIPLGRSGPCLSKLGQLLVVYGGYGRTEGHLLHDMAVFHLGRREWAEAPGSKVDLQGEVPNARGYGAADITDGVVYFTSHGVYKLMYRS